MLSSLAIRRLGLLQLKDHVTTLQKNNNNHKTFHNKEEELLGDDDSTASLSVSSMSSVSTATWTTTPPPSPASSSLLLLQKLVGPTTTPIEPAAPTLRSALKKNKGSRNTDDKTFTKPKSVRFDLQAIQVYPSTMSFYGPSLSLTRRRSRSGTITSATEANSNHTKDKDPAVSDFYDLWYTCQELDAMQEAVLPDACAWMTTTRQSRKILQRLYHQAVRTVQTTTTTKTGLEEHDESSKSTHEEDSALPARKLYTMGADEDAAPRIEGRTLRRTRSKPNNIHVAALALATQALEEEHGNDPEPVQDKHLQQESPEPEVAQLVWEPPHGGHDSDQSTTVLGLEHLIMGGIPGGSTSLSDEARRYRHQVLRR